MDKEEGREYVFFVVKKKTAYEMRISDWSSDVCSADLHRHAGGGGPRRFLARHRRRDLRHRPLHRRGALHPGGRRPARRRLPAGMKTCWREEGPRRRNAGAVHRKQGSVRLGRHAGGGGKVALRTAAVGRKGGEGGDG